MNAAHKLHITPTEITLILSLFGMLISSLIYGYQLITQAQLQRFSELISDTTHAWYAFKNQYKAMPGDFAYAQTHIDSLLTNGNGDHKINTEKERGQLWQHLNFSGLLDAYTDGKEVEKNEFACNIKRCLNNGYGHGINISYGRFSLQDDIETNAILTGNGIPLRIFSLFDKQYDDGKPLSGKVQIAAPGKNWSEEGFNQCISDQQNRYATPSHRIKCSGVIYTLSS